MPIPAILAAGLAATTLSSVGSIINQQTSQPQTSNFIKMINDIKGSRTVKEFSENTGIDPTILSRMLNNKYSPGPKILEKMIAPASSPQAEYSLQELLEAAKSKNDPIISFSDIALNIIKTHWANLYGNELEEYISPISYNDAMPDKIYHVEDISWWFSFLDFPDTVDASTNYELAKKILSKYIFTPSDENRKISFVINSRRLFSELVKFKSINSIRANISVILIEKDDDNNYFISKETFVSYFDNNNKVDILSLR